VVKTVIANEQVEVRGLFREVEGGFEQILI
jgi:hypothetical protein